MHSKEVWEGNSYFFFLLITKTFRLNTLWNWSLSGLGCLLWNSVKISCIVEAFWYCYETGLLFHFPNVLPNREKTCSNLSKLTVVGNIFPGARDVDSLIARLVFFPCFVSSSFQQSMYQIPGREWNCNSQKFNWFPLSLLCEFCISTVDSVNLLCRNKF